VSILAIDPGTTRSAWVLYGNGVVLDHDLEPNERLMQRFLGEMGWSDDEDPDELVIEDIEPRQQPLGREVADTLRWIGRFMEAARPLPVHLITRRDVTKHLIDGGTKNADSRIRAALIDRWGPGSERKGGPLYGITADRWQALAVAVMWADLHPEVADAA
jgi:hypothetical protein